MTCLQESYTCPCHEPYKNSWLSPSYFLKTRVNIILPSASRFSKWSLSLGFNHKILYAPLFFPIHATCHAYQNFQTLHLNRPRYPLPVSSYFGYFHFICIFCIPESLQTGNSGTGNNLCLGSYILSSRRNLLLPSSG